MDASVSVKTSETAEMDELGSSIVSAMTLTLRPG
jgi:hypothetical protein